MVRGPLGVGVAAVAVAALAVVEPGCAAGLVDPDERSSSDGEPPIASDSEEAGDDRALFAATDVGSRCPGISIDRDAMVARARTFSQRHGVETLVAFDDCPPDENVVCRAVSSRELPSIVTFLDQVDEELDAYPADFFRTIHLDFIVFGAGLATTGSEPLSLGGAVVPRGDHRSVLFLSTMQARFCDATLNARTLHHEIGHALDIGLSGVSETTWWQTLNPAGFTYGGGDLHATDLLDVDHPASGLVSRYARESVREDHAEVYGAMFVPNRGDALRGWLMEDRWLAAKFHAMLRPLEARWPLFVRAMPNHDALP